jgi:hypothetical protein
MMRLESGFAAAVDRFVGWFRGRFPMVVIELDRRLVRCERDETDSPAEHDHHNDRGRQEHVPTLPVR